MAVNGYTAEPMPQRFWDKVQFDDGCWEWQASRAHFGHGMFSLDGKEVGAHRMAWLLTYGDIPVGLSVLHGCDNPPCVRPDHLFLGTQMDNVKDAVTKRRTAAQKKTHCPQGHEYTEANTYRSTGHRVCRACRLERDRQRYLLKPRSQLCKRGHLRIGDNRGPRGRCLECARMRAREWARKNYVPSADKIRGIKEAQGQ